MEVSGRIHVSDALTLGKEAVDKF